MTRQDIFEAIESERAYQDKRWGTEFDQKNTPNDWVAYVAKYIGQAVTMPFDGHTFRKMVLKVATICVAVLEQEDFASRHYDDKPRVGRVP